MTIKTITNISTTGTIGQTNTGNIVSHLKGVEVLNKSNQPVDLSCQIIDPITPVLFSYTVAPSSLFTNVFSGTVIVPFNSSIKFIASQDNSIDVNMAIEEIECDTSNIDLSSIMPR